MLLDDRFVEAGRLLELVLLHEQDVRHVQLPRVVLVAEFHALSENLFNLENTRAASVCVAGEGFQKQLKTQAGFD